MTSIARTISATVLWPVSSTRPPRGTQAKVLFGPAVGRWQKNRDLSWYAKSDTSPAALSAAEARREELRKIKEAEQDALSEALGYGPMPRRNANETPLGKKEVEKAIKETAEGEDMEVTSGVGFGTFDGLGNGYADGQNEVLGGVGIEIRNNAKATSKGNERRREIRTRSRSRDRHRQRRHEEIRSRDRSKDRRRKRRIDENLHHDPKYRSHEKRERQYGHHRERSTSHDDRYHGRRRDRSSSPDYYGRRHHSRDRNYDRRR